MVIKAIQYNDFGNEEVLDLVTVEAQVLLDHQVRVRVCSVGLNPIDYKIFEGVKQLRMLSFFTKLRHPGKWFESKKSLFPRGVGRDFSGIICEVGKGVSNFSVGDEVFGTIISAPGLGTKKGALATEICVSETEIALMPKNIDFDHAATMGVAALTVGGAFRKIGLSKDDTIVISAASGGIGSIAVQYAASMGATVLGIASKQNADYLKSIGAIPIAYGENVKDSILAATSKPITKLLDCYGREYVDLGFELGLKGENIGTLVPSPYVILRGAKFTGPRHSNYDDFIMMSNLVSNGDVSIHLDKVYDFSLSDIKEAYKELRMGHTKGKKVVKIKQ